MNWAHDDRALPRSGFPIRKSPDQSLLSGSPGLFAASHVLRRLLAPRHPPCALSSLTMIATRHATSFRCRCRNRLGELPRACSLTDLPVQIVKDRRSESRRTHGSWISVRPPESPRSAGESEHPTLEDGADGDRTHDLRLAKPALSQLSYSPADASIAPCCAALPPPSGKVGPGRVELPTLPLSGVRSSQLSYGPGRACRAEPPVPPVSQN